MRSPRVSIGAALIAVVLSGCGDLAPASRLALESGSSCLRVSGHYDAVFTLASAEGGECRRAKPVSYDRLEFDEAGQFVSPAQALLPCVTRQLDCALEVSCDSVFASARFAGALSTDGVAIVGSAELRGAVSDCERVTYLLEASRRAAEVVP